MKIIGPEYVQNIFSRSLKKASHQKKTECLLFNFQFLNDKIDQNTNFAKLSSAKWLFFGIIVNFAIQKLNSKHLVCLSFLWWEVFFEGTRENILHIFRAIVKMIMCDNGEIL